MPKRNSRPKPPTYRLHRPTNTARCWINGGWKSLGAFGSPESHDAFAKVLAEFRASPGAPEILVQRLPGDITVDEVALAFWRHAEQHYRRADGTATNELSEYKYLLRVLRPLYGTSPAVEFGPRALKAVRQAMIDRGWNRNVTNNRIRRLKHIYKWASGEELVPVTTYTALTTVTGLQKGRSLAAEPEPISPVAFEHVTAILPELPRPVCGLVLFCLYSACRPGEACALCPADIDQVGNVWLFKPGQHKNAHRGKKRAIAIGPRAQAVLTQFWPTSPTDYFFSPRQAVAEMRAARSRARQTPRYPSHMTRNADKRKASPKRVPGSRYTTHSVEVAITRAIEAVNRSYVEAGVEIDLHVANWSPNQLRHLRGTLVRRQYGLEAAQTMLGHANAAVTEIYAERDLALAMRVAADIG